MPRQQRATARAVARPRFGRKDRIISALFVLAPVLLYVPASLAGSPVVPGDNLTQNEPLRALAGELLRSGHLPAWDSLIWSGTPLLAGWNAGALFPGTWLFAFLPGVASWTINVCAVPIVCALGCYVLLRGRGCREIPSALGAALFTYTGFMSGQVVHLGLSQGTALTPWLLVGLDLLGGPRRDRFLAGVALSGAAAGLIILAGDPRAVSSAAVIAAIDLAGRFLRYPSARRRLLAGVASSSLLGAALGAVQWLPGLAFLRASQRSTSAYSFFGSGSLDVRTLVRTLLVPFFSGANGNFGLPLYQGSYNIAELTVGSGIVALVAAVAYLPPLVAQMTAWRERRAPDPDRRPLASAYGLLAVGLLLTLGTDTPLAHLLVHVPLFGGERLQSRNGVIVDFALMLLVTYLLEDRGEPLAFRASAHPRLWQATACLPALGVLAIVVVGLARPASVERALNLASATPAVVREMAPYLIGMAVLAAAIVLGVLGARRMSARARTTLLALLALADVASYVVNMDLSTVPADALATTNAPSSALAQLTGATGRFAIYNPAYSPAGSDPNTLDRLGIPDLNVLHGVSSVEGYGSIVDGDYQEQTGTHLFESFDSAALANGTFDALDLTTLLAPSLYFDEPISPSAGLPLAMPPDATHPKNWTVTGPGITAPAPYSSGPWRASAAAPAAFVFPAPVGLRSLTVILDPNSRRPAAIEVRTEQAGTFGPWRTARERASKASISTSLRPSTEAVEIRPSSTVSIAAVIANTVQPTERLLLDGALEGRLVPGHWDYAGRLGELSVFDNARTRGLAWLQPRASTVPDVAESAPGAVRVVSDRPTSPEVLAVDLGRPATLVRSAGWAPGWTALVRAADGGPTLRVAVRHFGLVQAVDLPAGRYRVTFSYAPSTLWAGFWLSVIGLAALIILLVGCMLARVGSARAVTAVVPTRQSTETTADDPDA